MQTRTGGGILTTLVAASLFLSACGGAATPPSPAGAPSGTAPATAAATGGTPAAKAGADTRIAGGKLRIGVVGPYSGAVASVGERIANATRMAADEQNAAGGVLGNQVEMVMSDDEGDPQKSTLVAQRLADDPSVVAVIGPMNTGAVMAAGPIYEKAGLPFITPSGTGAQITESGWKYVFRTTGRDDNEGPAAGKFIVETLKPKDVFMIDNKTAFEKGITDEVEKILKAANIPVRREQVNQDDKDLSSILTVIKGANPDLVYTGIESAQAALLVKQAQDLGLKLRIMGNGSMHQTKEFITGSGGAAEGAYVSWNARDPNTIPDAKAWLEKFTAKYGAPGNSEPCAYDAANVIFRAVQATGIKDGKVDRTALRDAIRNLKGYHSILGYDLTFDAKGDVPGVPVGIYQVKGDNFVEVAKIK